MSFIIRAPAKRVDLGDLEEAVAVVANHLQLVQHLLLEVAPALELVEAFLTPETERVKDSWNSERSIIPVG